MKYETEELIKIFTDWQGLEDETISLSEELSQKSNNSFIKVDLCVIEWGNLLQFPLFRPSMLGRKGLGPSISKTEGEIL